MPMPYFTRRDFIAHSLVSGAGFSLASGAIGQAAPLGGGEPEPSRSGGVDRASGRAEPVLGWLEDAGAGRRVGVTCGMPWPRGAHAADTVFAAQSPASEPMPTQTWPLAYWPDGTLKWTAHALSAKVAPGTELTVVPGLESPAPKQAVAVRRSGGHVDVDTGVIRCRIPTKGAELIERIERDDRTALSAGRLVAMVQNKPSGSDPGQIETTAFESAIDSVTVEQDGPVRAVVRIDGKHAGGGRQWLPFTVRLYFYAGDDQVRLMHSFIFDGQPESDFIRGLGVRFDVPMSDALYDRHVRFAGEDEGLWAEAVRGITGLRRDPGEKVRKAQVAGEKLPPLSEWDKRVSSRLDLIPAWNQYTLSQLSADGFELRKRTEDGHGWIDAGAGRRAPGVGFLGGPSGGVGFGLRDFWQTHPSQIDIRGAAQDTAQVTLWMWAPESRAMDTRFYHDGMGMDTYEEQLEGLEITYEDYEPGFGTAHGIARTNELMLWAAPSTPTGAELVRFADTVVTPPRLTPTPAYLLSCDVFGGLLSLPDRSTPAKAHIQDTLEFFFNYYEKQQQQRRWYGFWDYGDVMHTYDPDRHVWRYDVGGYAWDNSELSPDLWLWSSYLRSGRADVFRFAEAMTRHTGEVDVYHLGRFKHLGTRHNVQHWGDSAKQLRISTPAYRRFYYYLTADERVGDLMRDQADSYKSFETLDPIRKIREGQYEPKPRALAVGFGTDWGAIAAAWLTEWERTLDKSIRQKLVNAMQSIGEMPHGFFTGSGKLDPVTGKIANFKGDAAGVSHLSAVFGLFEINAELIQLLDVPAYERAWLNYCRYYNAARDVRKQALGIDFRTAPLTSAHSRLTAYAAARSGDAALAKRAWDEFFADDKRWAPQRYSNQTDRIEGPGALTPVDEAAWISTNDTSQWGLAAIQNLALIGEALPPNDPRTRP